MINIKQTGDFRKTDRYFINIKKSVSNINFDKYGKMGVDALSKNTPIDSGLTASSWYYTITKNNLGTILSFNNSNINENVQIAILLQYGHATRNGAWIEGYDYINPAIQPIFDQITKDIWAEVSKL